MESPSWLAFGVIGIGFAMLLVAVVWLMAAMGGWMADSRRQAPLLFVALAVITFPWGLLFWWWAETRRSRDGS